MKGPGSHGTAQQMKGHGRPLEVTKATKVVQKFIRGKQMTEGQTPVSHGGTLPGSGGIVLNSS